MDAVPADTAVIVNVPVDAPAATVIADGTVAIVGALLANETLTPPDGAATVRLTVPWTVAPAATLLAFNVTLETDGPVGELGDDPEPPHRSVVTASNTGTNRATCRADRSRIMIRPPTQT